MSENKYAYLDAQGKLQYLQPVNKITLETVVAYACKDQWGEKLYYHIECKAPVSWG